jgi:EAL domain-containing protein (putative c-di-GMP-specific phosphodiesterase class I)/FixJ family two-component response regulator
MIADAGRVGPKRFVGTSVFVLDDDPDIGGLVCNVLAGDGFVCRQFSAVAPFLSEFRASAPALIVLDLALGHSDAIEVIRQLKRLKYRGKVLLFSGREKSALEEVQAIGKRHGLAMLSCLRKPFRAEELRDRIQSLAEIPAAPAQATQESPPSPAVDLAAALQEGRLELWYQPKIELKGLSICGAEALLRARDPNGGVILPSALLPPPGAPVYQPLSRFVLERAMADWKRFAERNFSIRLAINVPASIIQMPSFMQAIREYLPADPTFPGLIVEITENDVIRDRDSVREAATQLSLYNVRIAIDDFGSAYSSFARLLEVPCVEVKLDRMFVAGCSSDQQKAALCRTVIDLAHEFDAAVCAEGVETVADLQALIAMGCDMAQGYLFAKPMNAESFAQSLPIGTPHTASQSPSEACQSRSAA